MVVALSQSTSLRVAVVVGNHRNLNRILMGKKFNDFLSLRHLVSWTNSFFEMVLVMVKKKSMTVWQKEACFLNWLDLTSEQLSISSTYQLFVFQTQDLQEFYTEKGRAWSQECSWMPLISILSQFSTCVHVFTYIRGLRLSDLFLCICDLITISDDAGRLVTKN